LRRPESSVLIHARHSPGGLSSGGAPIGRIQPLPGSETLTVARLSAEVPVDRGVEADLAGLATVRHCETADALLHLVATHQVDGVVVDLLDQTGASTVPLIKTARKQHSGLRIVIDLPAAPTAFEQAPALLQAGASEVAVRGYDRPGDMIVTVLAPDWQTGAGPALVDTVPPIVPKSLKPFAIACALKGSPRLTVELVAGWVRTSSRTIRSRLRQAKLFSPLAFLRYCSAAHAMCLLYPQRLHPNRVVERMRFGTRRALNELIEKYASHSGEAVPERWAYAVLLLRADEFLRRHPRPQPSNVGLYLDRLERYVEEGLTAEERVDLERWMAGTGLADPGEALDRMRGWSKARDLERDMRQRREETWARLLRSIGSELEP
jgi:hypothetical protein